MYRPALHRVVAGDEKVPLALPAPGVSFPSAYGAWLGRIACYTHLVIRPTGIYRFPQPPAAGQNLYHRYGGNLDGGFAASLDLLQLNFILPVYGQTPQSIPIGQFLAQLRGTRCPAGREALPGMK